MSTRRLVRFVVLLSGLCVLTGCGKPVKTDVSGTIKLHGQPPKYTGIEVVFQHPDGTLVTAPVAENGAYKAEGVPSGEVKVCFAYITPESVQQGVEFKQGGRKLSKPGAEKDAPKPKIPGTPGPSTSPIPEALRDTSTSNLTFKVEAGKPNTFDYDIK